VVFEEKAGLVFGTAYTDIEENVQFHDRRALSLSISLEKFDLESDYNAAFTSAYANANHTNVDPQRRPARRLKTAGHSLLSPYTLQDAIKEADVFESTFAILVYDPGDDTFVGLYSKDHTWRPANKKLFATMNSLAYLLRQLFPERFTPESQEFVLAIGSGDYPQVKLSKLPVTDVATTGTGGTAPVFMFGSAFRDASLYPNMVAMPMPEWYHLLCFEQWVTSGTVCNELTAATHEHGAHNGLEFGEENGLDWDGLIPQLIWRGSDFCYLPSLTRPQKIKPYAYKLSPGQQNTDELATQALRENYDQLTHRWKGVTLTAESEQEAKISGSELPWANIKFQRTLHREPTKYYLEDAGIYPFLRAGSSGSSSVVASPEQDLVRYDDTGIATGEYMRSADLAKYKYHIDLGGGGGTTWTGTVQKLAMPGLLFHHVTPTKDYIHDRLEPWRHYIPVSHDLRDLKSKFDWAESHPREARWISNEGMAFMRHLGSEEGFGEMFREDFVEPLRRAIEAYRPVEATHPGVAWRDVLDASQGGDRMTPIAECSGIKSSRGSCRPMGMAREHMSSLVYGIHRDS